MENLARIRELALRAMVYIVLWLLVTSVFAMMWLSFDTVRGHIWAPENYLRWSMVEWSTLAVLGPLAFWAAAKSPIEPPHRLRRFGIHLLLSIGFTLLAVLSATLLSLWVEPGNPKLGEQLEQFVTKHGETGFLAYWVLVMVRQVLQLHEEKSRRELQASRLQAQLAQSRLQVLKMQLHPHFLFNTLHAAATLVREDAAASEDMLLRLAELLRTYLDDDRQEITLARELELIELYLGIQRVRFKDRLTTRIDADADTLDCPVPSLILQPLVENAIGHGIGKNVGVDCVEIRSLRVDGRLCLEVRNRNSALDGEPDALFQRGIGLQNSRLRLSELYGEGGQIQIGPLVPRGVICRVCLPLRALKAHISAPRASAA